VGVSVRHPISLAQRIMTSTPHVLMAGEGAMALGESMDILETTTDR
jgi:isoaspartyl peptidase/L-asparaginase-like protein (Ntn-hydrolase superfamily)